MTPVENKWAAFSQTWRHMWLPGIHSVLLLSQLSYYTRSLRNSSYVVQIVLVALDQESHRVLRIYHNNEEYDIQILLITLLVFPAMYWSIIPHRYSTFSSRSESWTCVRCFMYNSSTVVDVKHEPNRRRRLLSFLLHEDQKRFHWVMVRQECEKTTFQVRLEQQLPAKSNILLMHYVVYVFSTVKQ